jgi:hypothetical protein
MNAYLCAALGASFLLMAAEAWLVHRALHASEPRR